MNRFAPGAVAGAFVLSAAFHALPSKAATETVLYSFCSQDRCRDGGYPGGSLIDVQGALYGTTANGGGCPHAHGTVFSLDPQTGALTILHSFCRPRATGDGANPDSGVNYVNGTLYGTTAGFGSGRAGVVFSLDGKTGSETVLYRFLGGSDGRSPSARPLNLSGILYGTTVLGGTGTGNCASGGCGTVFSLNPATGAEKVLHSFCSEENCADGDDPFAGLNHVNGMLYGTTTYGGAQDGGTVFSLDPNTGAEKVLYSFCAQANCTDGGQPEATLVTVDGTLYGTTVNGGTGSGAGCGVGCGTVFSLDLATGAESVLYSFCRQEDCADGAAPYASLLYLNGTLYGTTELGGTRLHRCSQGCGTAFSLDLGTGTESVLYAFCSRQACKDGKIPVAGLTELNGTFYGTTVYGGQYGAGAVFAITP